MKIINNQPHYMLSEAARLLGVDYTTLSANIKKGVWPAPLKLGKRLYFSEEHIDKLRKAIEQHRRTNWQQRLIAKGMYNSQEARRRLNVLKPTWQKWNQEGVIPKPSRLHGCNRYYDDADLAELRRIIDARLPPTDRIGIPELAETFGINYPVLTWHLRKHLSHLGIIRQHAHWYTIAELVEIQRYLEGKGIIRRRREVPML